MYTQDELVRSSTIFPLAQSNSISIKSLTANIWIALRAAEASLPATPVPSLCLRPLCTGEFYSAAPSPLCTCAVCSCTQLVIETRNVENATRGLTYYYKDITAFLCIMEVYRICMIPLRLNTEKNPTVAKYVIQLWFN